MAVKDSGGKWQLAFWVMSAVIFSGLILLSNSVRANDKENIKDHKEIREEVSDKFDKLFEEVRKISERTTRIEANQKYERNRRRNDNE